MVILSDGMPAENRSIVGEQNRYLVIDSAIDMRYIRCNGNNEEDAFIAVPFLNNQTHAYDKEGDASRSALSFSKVRYTQGSTLCIHRSDISPLGNEDWALQEQSLIDGEYSSFVIPTSPVAIVSTLLEEKAVDGSDLEECNNIFHLSFARLAYDGRTRNLDCALKHVLDFIPNILLTRSRRANSLVDVYWAGSFRDNETINVSDNPVNPDISRFDRYMHKDNGIVELRQNFLIAGRESDRGSLLILNNGICIVNRLIDKYQYSGTVITQFVSGVYKEWYRRLSVFYELEII